MKDDITNLEEENKKLRAALEEIANGAQGCVMGKDFRYEVLQEIAKQALESKTECKSESKIQEAEKPYSDYDCPHGNYEKACEECINCKHEKGIACQDKRKIDTCVCMECGKKIAQDNTDSSNSLTMEDLREGKQMIEENQGKEPSCPHQERECVDCYAERMVSSPNESDNCKHDTDIPYQQSAEPFAACDRCAIAPRVHNTNYCDNCWPEVCANNSHDLEYGEEEEKKRLAKEKRSQQPSVWEELDNRFELSKERNQWEIGEALEWLRSRILADLRELEMAEESDICITESETRFKRGRNSAIRQFNEKIEDMKKRYEGYE